jgi:hypothetical protein
MNEKHLTTYESPCLEIVNLVIETPLLATSGELEDMDLDFGTWN